MLREALRSISTVDVDEAAGQGEGESEGERYAGRRGLKNS